MYINTKKTKALLVTGKRLQHQLSAETATLQLLLNATNMGLIIDKDLSFQAHIDELCKKLSKRLVDFWDILVLVSSNATN